MPHHTTDKRLTSQAFTMIELMIVIAVIALLTALVFTGAGLVRKAAQGARTTQRLEDITAALGQIGSSDVSAALRIHREAIRPELLRLGRRTGVLQWSADSIGGARVPVDTWTDPANPKFPDPLDPAALDGNWLDLHSATDPGWCWALPWGPKPIPLLLHAPAGTEAGLLVAAIRSDPVNDALLTALATRHLGKLDPAMTVPLLRLAGIVDDDLAWSQERSRNRPWNDAWGNPLVLSMALYQPTMSPVPDQNRTWNGMLQPTPAADHYQYVDRNQVECYKAYGYSRAVYLSAASAGELLRTPLSGSALPADQRTDAAALWQQVTEVAEAEKWDSAAWGNPPWRGVKRAQRRNPQGAWETVFLTAPVEIR